LIDYQGYFKAVKRKRLDTAGFISFLTAKIKRQDTFVQGGGWDTIIR